MEKKRESKYDVLRIIACFSVVLLHVSNSYWYTVDVHSSDFLIMTVYNSFTRFAIPVFFMLSGLFLLDPAKEAGIGSMLARTARLAVTFYIWSAFYAFQSVILHILKGGWSSVTAEMWGDAFSRFVNGHGHMWFLLNLIGFYLLTPVLRKICEDIRILGYFLFLWVLVRFVLMIVLPAFHLWRLNALLEEIHLYMLIGYVGYYVGGYFLARKKIPPKVHYFLYAAGVGSVILMNVLTITKCRKNGEYIDYLFQPGNILALIFAVSVFVLFSSLNITLSPKTEKIVNELSKLTFFVYLAHPFFIEKLNLLGVNTLSFAVILSVPVLTVLVILLCLVGGFVVRKIPVVGKWIAYQ